MNVARHALLLALTAVACSGGRARDRLANQNPRSEFGTEAAPTRAVSSAPAAPPRDLDGGAETSHALAVRTLAQVVTRAVAVEGARVFFGDAGDDGLFAMPKQGGDPVRVARRAPVRNALVVDRGQATWIGSPGDVVLRVATTGGTPTTLRDRGLFTDVASSSGDAVFTEAASGGGAVMRVTGATAARLATLEAPPHGLALDGEDAYVIAGDKLLRVPRARGQVDTLAAAASMASPVVSGDRIYVVAAGVSGEHVVLAVPKTGGQPSPVARRVRARSPLAVHGGVLWVIDADRPRLRAITIATGAEVAHADHEALANAVALAADDDGVFVATDEAGLLLAVAPRPRG